jgi:hypothetical protein
LLSAPTTCSRGLASRSWPGCCRCWRSASAATAEAAAVDRQPSDPGLRHTRDEHQQQPRRQHRREPDAEPDEQQEVVAPEETAYGRELLRDAGFLLLAGWLVVRPRTLAALDGRINRTRETV